FHSDRPFVCHYPPSTRDGCRRKRRDGYRILWLLQTQGGIHGRCTSDRGHRSLRGKSDGCVRRTIPYVSVPLLSTSLFCGGVPVRGRNPILPRDCNLICALLTSRTL